MRISDWSSDVCSSDLARLEEAFSPGLDLADAAKAAISALAGPDRTFAAEDLEVAVLSRSNGRRAFGRLEAPTLPHPLRSTPQTQQSVGERAQLQRKTRRSGNECACTSKYGG